MMHQDHQDGAKAAPLTSVSDAPDGTHVTAAAYPGGLQIMTLDELYRTLGTTPLPAPLHLLGDGFAHKTALGLLASFEGVPLAALERPGPAIAERYPRNRIPPRAVRIFGGNIDRYWVWRRLVLDSLLLGLGQPVDPDPWSSLYRLARLFIGDAAARQLPHLRRHLPAGIAPQEVTPARVHACDQALSGRARWRLRCGARAFDQLFAQASAQATGLLPSLPIGPFPNRPHHLTHTPLPPRLRAQYDAAPLDIRTALSFVWRLACLADLVTADADLTGRDLVAPALRNRLLALDPSQFGFRAPKRETYRAYLRRLTIHFRPEDAGAPLPVQSRGPAAMNWHELRKRLRAAGVSAGRLSALSALSQLAEREGLGPADLTPEWVVREETHLIGERHRSFRSGAFLLDDSRQMPEVPPALLPRAPLGLERERAKSGFKRPKRAVAPARPPVDPIVGAWTALFAAARTAGVTTKALHPLYALKTLAQQEGLRPSDLRPDWVAAARDRADPRQAAKLSRACRLLDDLHAHAALRPLLPPHGLKLPDRRTSAPQLSAAAARHLDHLLDLQGVSPSRARAARIAVKALSEAREAAPDGPDALLDLLSTDLDDIAWGVHTDNVSRYTSSLRALQITARLSRHAEWRALQEAVVAAGVPARDNPVPYFFDLAKGQAPVVITADWIAARCRAFRSTLAHPPHGRADLALTLLTKAARLDALHGHPALRGTRVLPPIIGAVD